MEKPLNLENPLVSVVLQYCEQLRCHTRGPEGRLLKILLGCLCRCNTFTDVANWMVSLPRGATKSGKATTSGHSPLQVKQRKRSVLCNNRDDSRNLKLIVATTKMNNGTGVMKKAHKKEILITLRHGVSTNSGTPIYYNHNSIILLRGTPEKWAPNFWKSKTLRNHPTTVLCCFQLDQCRQIRKPKGTPLVPAIKTIQTHSADPFLGFRVYPIPKP